MPFEGTAVAVAQLALLEGGARVGAQRAPAGAVVGYGLSLCVAMADGRVDWQLKVTQLLSERKKTVNFSAALSRG